MTVMTTKARWIKLYYQDGITDEVFDVVDWDIKDGWIIIYTDEFTQFVKVEVIERLKVY